MKKLLKNFFLNDKYDANSFLIFYYAGHGKVDDVDTGAYLTFVDTDADLPDARGLKMQSIMTDYVLKATAGKALAILNCCYSGNAALMYPRDANGNLTLSVEQQERHFLGTETMGAIEKYDHSDRGRYVIASCRPHEASWEVPGARQGVFNRRFLRGWRGGENGEATSNAFAHKVTINSLKDYLARRMRNDAQRPIIYGPPDADDFIINNDPSGQVELDRLELALRLELTQRLSELGLEDYQTYILPPFVTIPEGSFDMGSSRTDETKEERHSLSVPTYAIARFPVTVAEYRLFLQDAGNGHIPVNWEKQKDKLEHPVTGVSWYDVVAYCDWLTKMAGVVYRLADEAEWEKAARWDVKKKRSLVYPWGDDWDPKKCKAHEMTLQPIGGYQAFASQYGVEDLVGNIQEWTSCQFLDYPFVRELATAKGDVDRVLRGQPFQSSDRESARAEVRQSQSPSMQHQQVGFRIVREE